MCNYTVAIGSGASANTNSSIVIGAGATAGSCSTGVGHISIGSGAGAGGKSHSIAIGSSANAGAEFGVAIGHNSYNQIDYSTSIFAGYGPNSYAGAGHDQCRNSVRFTQVAGDSPDSTYYVFQHITGGGECSDATAKGVIISATNFFTLLKGAGGVDYNVVPSNETVNSLSIGYCSTNSYCSSDYCSSTYCTSDYCSSDNYC